MSRKQRFEVLEWRPDDVPIGLKCAPLRGGDQLAYLEDETSEEEVSLWTSRWRGTPRRSATAAARRGGHLAARAGVRQQPDASWEGEESPMPGPDALCVTFAEVYLPFGFHMSHAQIARMYRPCGDGSRRLRIRDAMDVS